MSLQRLPAALPVLLLFVTLTGTAQTDHIGAFAPPPHPRLLLYKGEEQLIQKTIAGDKLWQGMHQAILAESNALLSKPPIERIQIGRRLLDKSREAIRRLFFLSYAYRLTRTPQYYQRAEKEMLAIAAFSDWNPSHFLDVAEMTLAVAIGYDWLYDELSPASRATIKAAILQKGLAPSLDSKNNGWLKVEHNWNQVCNAGITYGAMAIYEDEPVLAKQLINRAIETIVLSMADYAPDGAYPEGYGYWGYGTSFNVLFNSAIEKLFGKDFGLHEKPGFLKTAGYLEHMTGPSGRPFNYSDAGGNGGLQPAMFWFAHQLKDPTLLWVERNRLLTTDPQTQVGNRLLPAIMLWGAGTSINEVQPPASTLWTGKGKNPVALMRTSWTDPNAIFVGMKGGSVSVNHAHMDIGSFVMEADGVRWAMDFGMQDYESLESKGIKLFGRTQDAQRWTVFRLTNLVHNTLTINNQHQRVDGYAPITSTASDPSFMQATTDMTAVYKGMLTKSKRGIAIVDKSYVLVQDEVETPDQPTTLRWTLLTPASVRITGNNRAALTKDGKQLLLEVTAPANVMMKTWSTDPPNDYDTPNPGTILTGFEVTLPANTATTIRVALKPAKAAGATVPAIPLDQWKKDWHTAAATLRVIKQRVVSDLLAPPVNQSAIGQLLKTIQPDGTWPGINYKDVSRTGFQHKDHLENMLALARAYQKTGTPYYQQDAVKKAFSLALDYWLANDFRCDNWWWNEMGTPNLMINTLLVMDSSLTAKQRREGWLIAHRANMETFGARPGGDLMPIAGMLAKQGLFLMNEDTLRKALNAMQADVKISTGRGLKPDMSFHHRTDNVISTLTYGSSYASSFAYWAAKTAGTEFTFPDPLLQLAVNYFLDGICQSLVYRTWPDPGAMNRDITRQNALAKEDNGLPQNLLAATTYRAKELQEVLDVRNGKMKPAFTRDRYFWYSHYYTHQRPRYFASVRMHSARANNMEEPHNEEGIRNHFYGDGSLFISRTAREFNNIFPVWDWRKIPGTTILQKPELPHWRQLAKKGLTDFAGAASDGVYGVAAFDFSSVHDPLRAHKSWFFFDNEIVCLGAGIRTDTALPAATTLNQCLLYGNVLVHGAQKNNTQSLPLGNHVLPNTAWVLHDSIAYIFPQPTTLHLKMGEATGNWRQINHQAWATEAPVKKNVFTLWLDHDVQPQNAVYAWIVVPNMSAASAAAYRKQLPVKILSNTPGLQAVQHTALERTGIVFYQPGSFRISDQLTIATNQPCIVLLKTKGATVSTIAVTDPTQKLDVLQLTVNGRTIEVTLPQGAEAGSTVMVQ